VAAPARGCALAHEDRSRRQRPMALSAPSADRARALNSEVPRCAGRDPGAIRVHGAIQGHTLAGCPTRARVLRCAGETGVVRPGECPARPQGQSRPVENRGLWGAVCANTVRMLRRSALIVLDAHCVSRPRVLTSCPWGRAARAPAACAMLNGSCDDGEHSDRMSEDECEVCAGLNPKRYRRREQRSDVRSRVQAPCWAFPSSLLV
jgi:hypothetical protein